MVLIISHIQIIPRLVNMYCQGYRGIEPNMKLSECQRICEPVPGSWLWQDGIALKRDKPMDSSASNIKDEGAQNTLTATGDEAFLPSTQTQSQALFLFEELTLGAWKWTAGVRQQNSRISSGGGGVALVTCLPSGSWSSGGARSALSLSGSGGGCGRGGYIG